jgi:hypothetical protein
MKIDEAKKIEDLESIGSVSEIISLLNQKMTPYKIDESVDSYCDLLPYTYSKRRTRIEKYIPSNFFVSKQHEYIYYLTQHSDGEERLEKLGFKDEFVKGDKKDFKRWYKKISHVLNANSDLNASNDDITKIAFQKLESIKRSFGIKFDDEES